MRAANTTGESGDPCRPVRLGDLGDVVPPSPVAMCSLRASSSDVQMRASHGWSNAVPPCCVCRILRDSPYFVCDELCHADLTHRVERFLDVEFDYPRSQSPVFSHTHHPAEYCQEFDPLTPCSGPLQLTYPLVVFLYLLPREELCEEFERS